MHMTSRLAIVLLAAVAVLACGGDSTGPQVTPGANSLAVAPSDGGADGVVRGTVRGMRLTNSSDTTSFERVAGATIAVYQEFTRLPTDSSTPPLHTLVGRLTTNAQGSFELTRVPTGYFQLQVTPPTGSPYRPGTSGTVGFATHSTDSAIVWLSLK
jgi:hypothetical protein